MNRILTICRIPVFFIFLLYHTDISAQNGNDIGSGLEPIATVGVQFNTIFASDLFRTSTVSGSYENVNFNLVPRNGYSIGALAKLRLSRQLYIHTGLNMLRQNYRAEAILNEDVVSVPVRTTKYEMPILLSYYLRMSEQFFLNLSSGLPIQYVPSRIASGNEDIVAQSVKISAFGLSSATNLGLDYRTEEDGTFYIGAIYNIALTNPLLTRITLRNGAKEEPFSVLKLRGDYFGIVLRYYFK